MAASERARARRFCTASFSAVGEASGEAFSAAG
jgi:hypothetical protein